MPAAAQRSRMSPSFQHFTLRAWSRTISIMDSTGLVEATTSDSRRFFLNAPTSTADAWFAEYEWGPRGPIP